MSDDPEAGFSGTINRFVSKTFPSPPDEPVTSAADKMKMLGITEAVVVRAGLPTGILTERDILYDVVAAGLDPSSTKVVDVMASPFETVEYGSKAREAVSKMIVLGVRRLGVVKDGKLVGLLVKKSIVSGVLTEQVPLAELAAPGQMKCPYCGEERKDGDELAVHMAHAHVRAAKE
ncbi:MAG: CBS domain-containing protein [Nitrososphaerota archaeon]|nr:CBS domain-containing protein [Nitrososphaerota archaeon]